MVDDGASNKGNNNNGGTGGGGLVQLFFLLSVALCVLLYAPRVLVHVPLLPYPNYYDDEFIRVVGGNIQNKEPATVDHLLELDLDNQVGSPCSAMRNGTICCDRSDFNTDVCFMAGDVRFVGGDRIKNVEVEAGAGSSAAVSLLLFHSPSSSSRAEKEETKREKEIEEEEEQKIRPYTRKWDSWIMRTIHEVRLRRVLVFQEEREEEEREKEEEEKVKEEEEEQLQQNNNNNNKRNKIRCDVQHDAPLLVMTAGGYTGNLFHAFSDGFLPAWVTAQHLRRRVVLGVLSYNPWWAGTFGHIISGLSEHDVVDLLHDRRTHCFPGAIVGTRFHGVLTVDPARLRDRRTIVDFHDFLSSVYDRPMPAKEGRKEKKEEKEKPVRLGIVSRKGTRVIENQSAVADLARSVGFDVRILETANGLPLPAVYASVSACDALLGVHGADLTKFLFLRPGHASLTQISPLGVSPIARDCFGRPATRMGLHYEQYEVTGPESSLSRRYAADDAVVADPETATRRGGGWNVVAKVYLGGQNVSLDLGRFRETLQRMHDRALQLRQTSMA